MAIGMTTRVTGATRQEARRSRLPNRDSQDRLSSASPVPPRQASGGMGGGREGVTRVARELNQPFVSFPPSSPLRPTGGANYCDNSLLK